MASIIGNVENNVLSSIGSFAESQAALALKQLLVTRQGATGVFDPVWKMITSTVVDPNTGSMGNPAKSVAGDPGGSNPPKSKFLYTVAIEYNAAIKALLSASNGGASNDPRTGSIYMDKMVFGVKTASRPNPSVTYQDVNMYNYRTKVATKVDYGTATITFYDDVNNTAHDIYRLYLQTISPISNVANAIYAPNFAGTAVNPQTGDPNVSSLGALPNGQEAGLINTVTVVHQMPLDYSQASVSATGTLLTPPAGSSLSTQLINLLNPFQMPAAPSAGNTVPVLAAAIQANTVQYTYMNPKIINFTLDDLDMTQSDVTTVSLTFTYDTVYIANVPIAFDLANSADASIVHPSSAGFGLLSNLAKGLPGAGALGAVSGLEAGIGL